MTKSEFYQSADIAEMFGVCHATISLWRKENRGPPFLQIGPRSYRYRMATVDAYMAALDRGETPTRRQGRPLSVARRTPPSKNRKGHTRETKAEMVQWLKDNGHKDILVRLRAAGHIE